MPTGIAQLGGAQALTTELRPVLPPAERGTASPNIAQTLSDPAASDGVRAPNQAGQGGGAGGDAHAGDPSRRNEQALAERRGAADARTGDFVRLSASGPQTPPTAPRRTSLQTRDGLYQARPRVAARAEGDGDEPVALSEAARSATEPRRRAPTEVVVDAEDVTRAATTRPSARRPIASDELGAAAPEDRPPTRAPDAERPRSLRDVADAEPPPTQVVTRGDVASIAAGRGRQADPANDSVEQAVARVTDPIERDRARAEEEAAEASERADQVREEGDPTRPAEAEQARDEQRALRRQARREQARVLERQRAEAEEAAAERQRLREEARAASEARRRTLEQLLAQQAARREDAQQTAEQTSRFPSLRERQAAERAAG